MQRLMWSPLTLTPPNSGKEGGHPVKAVTQVYLCRSDGCWADNPKDSITSVLCFSPSALLNPALKRKKRGHSDTSIADQLLFKKHTFQLNNGENYSSFPDKVIFNMVNYLFKIVILLFCFYRVSEKLKPGHIRGCGTSVLTRI